MKRTHSFDPVPESVTAARRFVTAALQEVPGEAREVVPLMVSELASNCLRHGDGGFELTVIVTPAEVRVEATDGGAGRPQLRYPDPTDPTGRGLQIVDMFSSRWGIDLRPGGGKTVWLTLAVESPTGAGASA